MREHIDLLGCHTWLISKRVIHITAKSELQTSVFFHGHLHDRNVLGRWYGCTACWIDCNMVVDFRGCTFASRLNCFLHFGSLATSIRDDGFWWHLDSILR